MFNKLYSFLRKILRDLIIPTNSKCIGISVQLGLHFMHKHKLKHVAYSLFFVMNFKHLEHFLLVNNPACRSLDSTDTR